MGATCDEGTGATATGEIGSTEGIGSTFGIGCEWSLPGRRDPGLGIPAKTHHCSNRLRRADASLCNSRGDFTFSIWLSIAASCSLNCANISACAFVVFLGFGA
jgi:hypothetical protein